MLQTPAGQALPSQQYLLLGSRCLVRSAPLQVENAKTIVTSLSGLNSVPAQVKNRAIVCCFLRIPAAVLEMHSFVDAVAGCCSFPPLSFSAVFCSAPFQLCWTTAVQIPHHEQRRALTDHIEAIIEAAPSARFKTVFCRATDSSS